MSSQPLQTPLSLIALELKNASSLEEVKKLALKLEELGRASIPALDEEILPTPDKKTQLISELRNRDEYLELKRQNRRIGRSDAAEKYNVPVSSIQNWEKMMLEDGTPLVKVYERGFGRGQQVMVDEADVWVMVEMNRIYRKGQRGGPLPGFVKRRRKVS